jgi:hypothetical protein
MTSLISLWFWLNQSRIGASFTLHFRRMIMNCVSNKNLGYQTLLIGGAVLISALGANAAGSSAKPAASSANVAKTAASAPATTPAPAAASFKELPDTATAAEVNGVKISMKDINHAITSIKQREPSLADGSAAANGELTKFRQSMLHDLVDFELLLQEAKKRNIKPDPKKVDAEIWQIKAKFPTPDVYAQWLKMTGQTEDD